MAEPQHNKGKSKQDYGTPKDFLIALKRGLGIKEFEYDLAASPKNAVAPAYYTQDDDALTKEWKGEGWLYCNPPYKDITPWVAKAQHDSLIHDARVCMLLPASVGSNWWRNYVHNEARVWFLNRRIQFVGATEVSPKDHAIVLYSPWLDSFYEIWDWQNERTRLADAL